MRKPNNKQRKGFTIVELVIVIAVVAVLAGVMIPTFGGIIETANRSADTQLVAQINTILFVEEELGGGVNDAVEIQKIIKENGLKLETKSKGQYIWYDVEAKKVVLAGLDENGIVLNDAPVESNDAIGYINANRPVLLADGDDQPAEVIDVPKGSFKSPTCPEDFIQGYLFISEKSADGLADAIHILRTPEGDKSGMDKTKVTEALTDALGALDKIAEKGKVSGGARIATMMQDLMAKTAVVTEYGIISIAEPANVLKVILSSETKILTAQALSDLANFPKLYVVDFHSGVEGIENVTGLIDAGIIDAVTGDVNGIHFVYCNDAIDAIDKDPQHGGNIANLIHAEERSRYITKLIVKYVYLDKSGAPVVDAEGNRVQNTSSLGSEYPTKSHKVLYDFRNLTYNTETNAYDLKYYSFDISGSDSIAAGREGDYFLNEDEQLKIDKNGNLVLYAIFQEVDATFKIGGKCYSNAQTTKMLANPDVSKASLGGDIVVLGTNAKLDASLIGQDSASLTIPSGVTLWVPCTVTNYSGRSNNGAYYPVYDTNARATYGRFDKDNADGVNKLTIASNITLTNNGYITIDAQVYQQGDSAHFCFISNNSGVLVVNGKIINNSRMEAYGVVRTAAQGEVISKSGSTVTETMSVLDLHGGQTTIVSIQEGFSPFNHFTIDSIRLPFTIEYGAVYTAYGMIETSLDEHSMEFKIASSDGTPNTISPDNPLFNMSNNAKIVKSYKSGEGVKVTVYGTVEDCKKKISLGSVGDAVVDFTFEKNPMPLPNFDVTVANGASLTLSKATAYKLLPGSDIVVEEGGTLNLGCRVVVYDSFVLDGNGKTVVNARIYNEAHGNAFAEPNATLTVKGTIVLDSGAKFAGIILGDSNDANASETVKSTIIIKSGAATSCNPINECANGKYGGLCDDNSWDEYTVKDMNWTGRWQTAPETYGQIPATPGTYQYNGGTWGAVNN